MSAVIYVALGGAGGSVLRYLVALALLGPWATLAVNVAGSAAIGVAAGLGLQGEARLLLVTGFLGGFTTFSAFSLDTATLAERSLPLAVAYVLASVGLGIAAFALAFWLSRRAL